MECANRRIALSASQCQTRHSDGRSPCPWLDQVKSQRRIRIDAKTGFVICEDWLSSFQVFDGNSRRLAFLTMAVGR